jgi:hypothetical protein
MFDHGTLLQADIFSQAGIPTQCMKAAKCFRAKPQYYANITLK